MRIRGAKQVHYDSGPNMTPLVDVVMVILIFLMLAGSFGGEEHYLVSSVPIQAKGAGNVKPPPGFLPPTQVRIKVDVDPNSQAEAASLGSDATDADRQQRLRYIAKAGNAVQTGDYKQLVADLISLRKHYNEADTKTDDLQVIIEPGRNVLYRHLIDVYQAALEAGYTKVGFGSPH